MSLLTETENPLQEANENDDFHSPLLTATEKPRTLLILFRRDPTRDRQEGRIQYAGYRILWPDGSPVTLGLEAFCQRGQRLLGLDRHMVGHQERLIKLICAPRQSGADDIFRLPGYRVRRFFLERNDRVGRLFFMNEAPTETVFDLDRDDPQILEWIGMNALEHGERQWLDLVARPLAIVV